MGLDTTVDSDAAAIQADRTCMLLQLLLLPALSAVVALSVAGADRAVTCVHVTDLRLQLSTRMPKRGNS